MDQLHKNRRKFGQHFTSKDIFHEFILPQIQPILENYTWVDLFAGEGNLILPILDYIPEANRLNFFKAHIFLCDIQPECIATCIKNAENYGIPKEIATDHIILWDSLQCQPPQLREFSYPVFHITNPPYLYLGYIAKHAETHHYMPLFTGENEGLQDLYQIALYNDLKAGISQMIYIIPTNFVYGNSVSNRIRTKLLFCYQIDKAILFEYKIFEHTGINVGIFQFLRKVEFGHGEQTFDLIKINSELSQRSLCLKPKYNYKAGSEFEEFCDIYQCSKPVKIHYYLTLKEVEHHPGPKKVKVLDSNDYQMTAYSQVEISVSEAFAKRIETNILWVRTVDTGRWDGRAGLYEIFPSFGVSGILVTKDTYRTNPIQIFFDPPLEVTAQQYLAKFCNLIMEYLRKMSDSDFMTTYKYSSSNYVRKYFGLSQARKLIQTFPVFSLQKSEIGDFYRLIDNKEIANILKICKKYSKHGVDT